MSDQFQTLDNKQSICNGFIVRAWRLTRREIFLAVVAIFLLVMCSILAGLFGRSAVQLKKARTSAQRAESLCKDSMCLKTTAHIMELVNMSVRPCDNFFRFACGGYEEKNPVNDNQRFQNHILEMRQRNRNRLIEILESPVGRSLPWSSEKKLKDYFTSCMDDFRREQLKATPLIEKALTKMGGWYVLTPGWDGSSWDLNYEVKVVQTDLWLDALFSPRVTWGDFGSRKFVIAIYPGGTGRYMRWRDYISKSPKKRKLQNDYKKFMRTVATLVARDAGVVDNNLGMRIDIFIHDAFEVETKIAKFASSARYHRNRYRGSKKVTLDDLKQQTGNEIDWTEQISYLFNEAGVTGKTKIVEPYPTYLSNLTAMIRGLDPGERNRKLHNYLTWRVLEEYIRDLSWEYVHANRQMYVDKYGHADFGGMPRYCFYNARRYFRAALSALYVANYFEPRNKDKVTDITEAVKIALEKLITKNTWMDKPTKDYAVAKMKGSTYKIGYPDFITDESKVDAIYQHLSINSSDFFDNVLANNMQHRRRWNKLIIHGEDRNEWWFDAYDVNMGVWWYWDEVIVPAGILQFPLYMYDMPHYYSFGAIGTLLGHYVHHLIDDRGRRWDKGGDYMWTDKGWWSKQTMHNFNAAKQCVADLYSNVTQGPYLSINGQDKTVSVNGDQYAGEAMAITTGIRLAYNAYQTWQKNHGTDPLPPGLDYTPRQLFFIAHAQVYCYNREPTYDYFYTLYRNTNEETKVNVALQELPEFGQTFGCQASDKMMSLKPCTYY